MLTAITDSEPPPPQNLFATDFRLISASRHRDGFGHEVKAFFATCLRLISNKGVIA